MGNLTKRSINKKEFYVLTYNYRDKNVPKRIERSLGSIKPPLLELDLIQDTFDYEVFQILWLKTIEKIQEKHLIHIKKYPKGLKSKELRQFGILFTHNSSKIEGSTLSYRDTQILLDEGITPSSKPISDVIETQQHMKVYEIMTQSKNKELNLNLIKEWHKIQFFRTDPSTAGIFRGKKLPYDVRIGISKYKPPRWDKVESELMKLNLWYINNRKKLHHVYLSAKYHCWFEAIHPFTDGNGRTGRLLMNFILYKNNYPMFDIDPKQKTQYFNVEERSMVNQNYLHFIGWYCRNYIKYTTKYLKFFD